MTQVSSTPKVARVTPGASTDLMSLSLVSMPPVKRMIHIARVLSPCAVPISIEIPLVPNSAPMLREPKSIPTARNSSNAGTPYLYPILSAKILTKNSSDKINSHNSTCISTSYFLFHFSFFIFHFSRETPL